MYTINNKLNSLFSSRSHYYYRYYLLSIIAQLLDELLYLDLENLLNK